MRECLGWMTNCENRQGCPQNWLELSVSEIPADVHCHVCNATVSLVVSEEEVDQRGQNIVAFPVVPCTGVVNIQRAATAQGRGNGAGNGASAPAPEPARRPPPPQPTAQRFWYCTLANGESIKLDKDTMIIGRSRTCDIVIPSAKVSRQHASVSRMGDDYAIEDLGSANGVWRGGEKITKTKINTGDVFTISDETLTFDQR